MKSRDKKRRCRKQHPRTYARRRAGAVAGGRRFAVRADCTNQPAFCLVVFGRRPQGKVSSGVLYPTAPAKIKVRPWLQVSDVAVLCCRRACVSLVFSNPFRLYIRRMFLRNRGKARMHSDPKNQLPHYKIAVCRKSTSAPRLNCLIKTNMATEPMCYAHCTEFRTITLTAKSRCV